MKKNIIYMAALLLAGVSMTACSPDDFEGANQNGKPTTDGVSVDVSVDQATNTVTFTSSHLTGSYPLWYVQSNSSSEAVLYSTQESFSRVYAQAGDKVVQFYVGNRNGFSDYHIDKTIHINNTLKDLSELATTITSDEGKQWRVADSEENHFAYGSSNGDGTGTWAVDLANKQDLAFYDDFITLKTGTASGNFLYSGSMTYNPGADGKCQFGGNGVSDSKTAAAQESNYKISVSGDDILLTLDANTNFPFVPSESFLSNPVFRIESYSKSLLTLVAVDGDKAWRLVLTSAEFGGSSEVSWGGFTAGTNLLACEPTAITYYLANDGWSEYTVHENLEGTYDKGYSITLPAVGSTQWQGQIHLAYDNLTLEADKKYDYSVKIVSDVDGMVTVKPHKTGDDNTFWGSAAQQTLSAGDNVFSFYGVDGWDGTFTMTFDFGSSPNAKIQIVNLVVREHDESDPAPIDYNAAGNIWRTEVEAVDNGYTTEFYYAHGSGWEGYTFDPATGFKVDQKKNGSNIYTIIPPGATDQQWQAQNKLHTNLSATADDIIDFSCLIVPSVDMNVTVKLTEDGDDNNYFFAPTVSVKAGVANVVRVSGAQLSSAKDAAKLMLLFDLGGNPEGAEVQVSDIAIVKQ